VIVTGPPDLSSFLKIDFFQKNIKFIVTTPPDRRMYQSNTFWGETTELKVQQRKYLRVKNALIESLSSPV
jgi:hypothetical protein